MDKMEQAQEFLRAKRREYIQERESRQLEEGERWTPVDDTEIATWLGVSLTSWLAWLAGDRKDMDKGNVLQIARRWKGILPIFEMDNLPLSSDEDLNFVIEHWEGTNNATKNKIKSLIEESRVEPIR